MNDQAKVWKSIKQARGLLQSARDLEFKIEEERIAVYRRDKYYDPHSVAGQHDPLGSELEEVIEKLDEILE